MKKILKNTFYTSTAILLTNLNKVNAELDIDRTPVNSNLKWTDTDLVTVIQNWLGYLTWLLYLVVIIMMIYWGFNIITAGWADDKVKKWKTILMQAAGWLIVVFLANSLITWLINALFASSAWWVR